MKSIYLIISIAFTFLSACGKEEVTVANEEVVLTNEEKSDLLFLREEEKLAKDVYTYSFNKYGQNIFANISSSEQSHMNSVLTLLKKYHLTDPISNSETGKFSNIELQELYNQLTTDSNISITKALEVGATIEDLDIRDIQNFKNHTSKSDLLTVYNNLSCGSRNHLRSFVSQLGAYTPVYISQEEYQKIIGSVHEQCGK
jgi:hypothetical protein